MNKILFCIVTFLAYILSFCDTVLPTYASDDIYYRVINETTYLYKSEALDDIKDNIYFVLPETYFVKELTILNNGIIKVEYNNIIGYVKETNLQRVYQTPQNAYATQKLDIINVANAVLYNQPNTQSTYIGLIPFNTKDIIVYGTCIGEESIANNNVWYYVTYTSNIQGVITGYIHSSTTYNLTSIAPNTEDLPTENVQQTNTNDIIATELQNSNSLLLILCITIPALFLLYLLFKPEKRKHKKVIQNKNIRNLTYNNQQGGKNELDF